MEIWKFDEKIGNFEISEKLKIWDNDQVERFNDEEDREFEIEDK